MITIGYAKGYRYGGDGTLQIKVRIPNIHGPYTQQEYQGRLPRNYVLDKDLPYYPSILLPHLPGEGDVVLLSSMNDSNQDWVVLGLTGGVFGAGLTNTSN